MARLTIQMVRDTHRKERVVRVQLESDDDTTPREHEQDHRRHVAKLLPCIDLASESPEVRVERDKPLMEPPPPCSCDDGGYEVIDLG